MDVTVFALREQEAGSVFSKSESFSVMLGEVANADTDLDYVNFAVTRR